MEKRPYWLTLLHDAWTRHSLIWLSGVRRVGKTTLCKSLQDPLYFDCEMPSVRRAMADPELFLASLGSAKVVLDEVHRLDNPSELLKIATDHFPNLKIVATGSSSLWASVKFKDTLVGRKTDIWLTPMNSQDLTAFGGDLKRRLRLGGLPPFYLHNEFPESEYQNWLDAYWAKDVQELFRVEKRAGFMRFAELLFIQSGGIFEANSFTAPCELSRGSIHNYLGVLEATHLVHVIRPYHQRSATEIILAPKVYAFDTGFVVQAKGWGEIRDTDYGMLWEHYVLNELQSRLQDRRIHYWRDKRDREIDFVIAGRDDTLLAVECKWTADSFTPKTFTPFKRAYPHATCVLVSPDITHKRHHKEGDWCEWLLEELVKEADKVLNVSKR